jgi:hypothetical protein
MGQLEHTDAPASENLPVGHWMGLAEAEGQKDPAGHEAHEADPVVFAYLPLGQGVHLLLPPVLKVPAGQFCGVCATLVQNMPGGQVTQ